MPPPSLLHHYRRRRNAESAERQLARLLLLHDLRPVSRLLHIPPLPRLSRPAPKSGRHPASRGRRPRPRQRELDRCLLRQYALDRRLACAELGKERYRRRAGKASQLAAERLHRYGTNRTRHARALARCIVDKFSQANSFVPRGRAPLQARTNPTRPPTWPYARRASRPSSRRPRSSRSRKTSSTPPSGCGRASTATPAPWPASSSTSTTTANPTSRS